MAVNCERGCRFRCRYFQQTEGSGRRYTTYHPETRTRWFPGVTLLRVTSRQPTLPPRRAASTRPLADGGRSERQPSPALRPSSTATLINPQSSRQTQRGRLLAHFARLVGGKTPPQKNNKTKKKKHPNDNSSSSAFASSTQTVTV